KKELARLEEEKARDLKIAKVVRCRVLHPLLIGKS
ncbi:MAG: hypothetical protein ACJAXZ_004353, partial [Akkermansiaceae bacterium]